MSNKLFETNKKAKTYLPLGDQLVKEIYINRSQKLDIHGESGIEGHEAELRKQDWIFKKKIATKLMSLHGRAAMYYLMINGEKYADVARVQSVSTLAGWVMEAIVYSDRLHTYEGSTFPVALRFTYVKDHYVLSRIFVNEQGETIELGDQGGFHYPAGEVPIEILRNNADQKSDIDYFGVRELKDRINYWGKQIGEEWRLAGKGRQVNRAMYGDGSADSQFKKRFDSDNDTIKQGGINSKLAGDMLPTGGSYGGVGTAASVVAALRTEFRDAVMLHNNTIAGSGTNKHGLEIALAHQPAIDNILEQKAERDRAYSNFLSNLFGSDIEVAVHVAPTTQAILDGMAADLAIKLAGTQGGE